MKRVSIKRVWGLGYGTWLGRDPSSSRKGVPGALGAGEQLRCEWKGSPGLVPSALLPAKRQGMAIFGILAPVLMFTPGVAVPPVFLILGAFVILTVRDAASGSQRQAVGDKELVRNTVFATDRAKDKRYGAPF